jgi:diaminopimelate epimerase
MEIEFVKTSPTQNMTILVKSFVERPAQSETANLLMSYGSVYAEQVGFIERAENPLARGRLQMAGGEFCANAAMSLAVYLSREEDGPISVPLEISGSDGPIECLVRRNGENTYLASLTMSPPETIGTIALPFHGDNVTLSAIRLRGITHIVVPAGEFGNELRAAAEETALEWASEIDSPAFGIVFFDEKTCCIAPLIYVKDGGSMVWERGCGSASAAIGAYRACIAQRCLSTDVSQPGGVIRAEAEYSPASGAAGGAVTGLRITGTVKIVAEGTAYI